MTENYRKRNVFLSFMNKHFFHTFVVDVKRCAMKTITLTTDVDVCRMDELSQTEQMLIEKAKEATYSSYAPYSKFYVGAALLLQDGTVVMGSNQENAAYPSGLCAERTALFYANAQYPDQPVTALAIAARNAEGFVAMPVPPCGACRQVMLETQQRFGNNMTVLLCGKDIVYRVAKMNDLLPLSFGCSFLAE